MIGIGGGDGEGLVAPVQTHALDPFLLYQTSHVEPRLGIAAATLVVQAEWPSVEAVADFIDLEGDRELKPEEVVEFVRGVFWREWNAAPTKPDLAEEEVEKGIRRVARQLAFDDVIPWRDSPLRGEALAGLITKAGAVGTTGFGAFVGSYVGNGPLLLVTVPAGIILVGAASGIAQALREGLHKKVLALLAPESQEPYQ
jgi:hypothetical protein